MKDTKKNGEHISEETARASMKPPAAAAPAPQPTAPKPLLGTGEIIIGILVVILIGAVAYTYLNQAPIAKPPVVQPAAGSAADAFISSLYRMRTIQGYEMSYVETDGPMQTSLYLQSNITNQYGRFDSILDSREFYYDGTDTVLCLDYKGKSCYKVAKNGSIFDNYVQSVYAKFLESPSVRNSLRTNEQLVGVGAIKFANGTSKETVAGRSCTGVSYEVNYGGLSIDQLKSLGMSPDDPSITSFSNFRLSQCMDDQFGLALRVNLSYSELGKERAFSSDFSSFKEGYSGPVALPPADSTPYISEMDFGQLFNTAQKEIRAAYTCSAQNTSTEVDTCYRTLAYSAEDGRVCSRVSDQLSKSQCYLAVAQKLLDAKECAFAGSLADDCIAGIAGGTGDGALCKQLSNQSLIADCNKAVGEANARGIFPQNGTSVCNATSNCVVAGCNGELCVPAAIANQTKTACDPTLTCYKQFANCTCSAGACAWDKGAGFAACLDKWETAQTAAAIQPLINSTFNTTNSTADATGSNITNGSG